MPARKNKNDHFGTFLFVALLVIASFAFTIKLSDRNQSYSPDASARVPKEATLGVMVAVRQDTKDNIIPSLGSQDIADMGEVGAGDMVLLKELAPLPFQLSCVALSLEGMRRTVTLTQSAKVKCDYLSYNPEQNGKTPQDELDDFVAAVQEAKLVADAYGAKLLVGPGYQYMSQQEDLYGEAAALSDAWLLQSQAFQVDLNGQRVPPADYSAKVARVVRMLQAGNPAIKVWVQISVTPGRAGHDEPFSAQEIFDLSQSIKNKVSGVRVYDKDDQRRPETLKEVIALIKSSVISPACQSNADCFWCGRSCTLKKSRLGCVDVLPPSGYTCSCQQGQCVSAPSSTPSVTN